MEKGTICGELILRLCQQKGKGSRRERDEGELEEVGVEGRPF